MDMIKKSIIFLIVVLACHLKLNAQASIADITNRMLTTSPQAAAYTQYSKVPVSQFTGIPDIKIPLYDIKVDNFELPVYLSYYARGIQPNIHAGWVGTGWNLFAGAVITRKINDAPDELRATSASDMDVTCSTCNPQQLYSSFPVDKPLGWYWNYGVCNTPNWTSLIPTTTCTGDCPNYTGSITLSNSSAIFPSLVNDCGADEFDFNIYGISGAFFKGEDGKWKVRSDNGVNIQVTSESVGELTFTENNCSKQTDVGSTFRQFVLTTGDGTTYTFGNNDPNSIPDDANAIEFNRSAPLQEGQNGYDQNTIAMAWYITKITLPSGKSITFTYNKRPGVQYTYFPSYTAGSSSSVNTPIYPLNLLAPSFAFSSTVTMSSTPTPDVSVNITDPVYLSTISFPTGKIVFNSSASNEPDIFSSEFSSQGIYSGTFKTAYNTLHNTIQGGYEYQILPSGTVLPGGGVYPSVWMKLKDIELDDYNGTKLKDIALTYTTQSPSTGRLFLQSVQTTGYYGNGASMTLPAYTCHYNSGILPGYCSPEVDYWGFYNGATTNPYSLYGTSGFANAYMSYRAPSQTGAQQYGILTELDYPTGGFAQFTYEPNKYSQAVNQFQPIAGRSYLQTISPDATGAGVRIQKIVSQTDASSPTITYQYSYLNNNGVSSGVLGMPPPEITDYTSSLNIELASIVTNGSNSTIDQNHTIASQFSSNNKFPNQNDDGNIVTYSQVTETQTGNGSSNGTKVTTFSNHDNGYGNNPPDAYYWINTSDQMYLGEYDDRSFERGHVLSESYLDNSGTPIKTIINTYAKADANSSYSKSVLTGVTYFGGLALARMTAVRNYYFYPYLQKTVETDYQSDHLGTPVVTTTDYSYDATNGTRNLIKRIVNTSNGQILIDNMRYPKDIGTPTSTDAFSLGIKNLEKMNAIGIPVEKYVQRSNADKTTNIRTVSALLNSFNANFPFPNVIFKSRITSPLTSFTPATTNSSGLVSDPSYEPLEYVDNFDAEGNVLNLHKSNDINESFQWGYNSEYPVAKVINAANTYQAIYSPSYSTVNGSFVFPPNTFTGQSVTFTLNTPGSITLSMGWGSNPGSNSSSNVSFQLFGPVNEVGAMGTGNLASPVTFTNMPTGNYSLSITPNINGSLANLYVYYSYPLVTQVMSSSSGIKEFFYDGFEENTSSSVVSGTAHTGNKYWGASTYATNFTLPTGTSRKFVIQWWNLSGGVWKFNEQPYTGNTTLTGPVDDIRIFPADAQMSTYTYQPLIGETSQTDANGRTTYYEYDPLNRLSLVRDQDHNILKKICYNYAGQPGQCALYQSDAINANYYSKNCGSESPVAYQVSVPQGMFTSYVDQATANQLAQQYAQNQANQYGTCQVSNISIYGDDEIGTDFTVTLHNVSTGQDYSFYISAHNGYTLDNVPPGDYDISLTPNSSTGWFNYSVGCGYYDEGPGGSTITFYAVPLSSSCNGITID